MRYRFVGTLLMLGGFLLSSSDLYAATRCRKDKCIQPKPCPPKPCAKPKCPPRVMDPCENRIGKGPGYHDCDLKPAFSAPARINPHCGWDIQVNASFIYWIASQEGLDFGIYSDGETPLTAGLIFQKFNFEPGFKVSAGSSLGTDNWTGVIEYTRLHVSEREDTFAPNTDAGLLFVNHYATDIDFSTVEDTFQVAQAKTTWKCDLDVIDMETARWFYSGQMFTMGPFLGARGGWLDQNFNLSSRQNLNDEFTRSKHRSKSWFIGPRVGLDMNWILGYGLRATGSMAGSLLYQRQRVQSELSVTGFANPIQGTFKNTFRHVRSNAELGLALGWGTYLAEDAFHIDFLAGYEFHYWAKQNVMRTNVDSLYGQFTSPGDLTYHGLTLTVRFDF